VIIGDKNGALHGPAVKNCYSVLDIVNRFVANQVFNKKYLCQQGPGA
jgi:hypothetical protein